MLTKVVTLVGERSREAYEGVFSVVVFYAFKFGGTEVKCY